MLFFWTFYSSLNPEKIKCITVSTKILGSTTVFNIDNNNKCFLSSKSAYYYDFWRSCDTEDCSNDAENTALITEINYILTHIHTYAIIFHCFYCVFDQIIAALVSILNKYGEIKIECDYCGCFSVFQCVMLNTRVKAWVVTPLLKTSAWRSSLSSRCLQEITGTASWR